MNMCGQRLAAWKYRPCGMSAASSDTNTSLNTKLRAIEDAKVDPSKSTRLRAYAAQYTIMENAQDIARLAIRTCGGQSMLKSLPLERLYRDARCGSLMLPWTAELCMDRIGREALYEPGEKDA